MVMAGVAVVTSLPPPATTLLFRACCCLHCCRTIEMDKYLVKMPFNNKCRFRTALDLKLKQSTLESLGGVVIIEDVVRCKRVLEDNTQLPVDIMANLNYLHSKNPSKEILKSTGIGKTIHKLCRHSDENISKLAKIIYDKWKTNVIDKATKPLIDVRCDLKTESFRLKAKNFLRKSLLNDHDKLADRIEKEIFYSSKRLISGPYRNTVRRTVFVLKKDDVRNKLTSKEITIKEFISTHCKP